MAYDMQRKRPFVTIVYGDGSTERLETNVEFLGFCYRITKLAELLIESKTDDDAKVLLGVLEDGVANDRAIATSQ